MPGKSRTSSLGPVRYCSPGRRSGFLALEGMGIMRRVTMRRNYTAIFISVFAVTILVVGVASYGTAEPERPCAEDLAKYCGGITPGGGRLLQCYEEQKKNMSPKCVSWAEYLKSNAGYLKDACSREIDQFCNS